MADPLSQFSMMGSGFNSQLVPNPNAAGASQQQSPSDSMQPIGGLPNPEHSRMWMQLQQQINQQRTTSSGDIVGSQVTLDPLFATSLSLFPFSLLPFLPSLTPALTLLPCARPRISSSTGTALRPPLAFAYVSSGFRYVSSHPAPSLTNDFLNDN
jgi:hypothetical protein